MLQVVPTSYPISKFRKRDTLRLSSQNLKATLSTLYKQTLMAVLLRFLPSPSLTHNFPTEQQQLTRTPLSNLSNYNYKHNLSHSVSIKTKRRLSNSNFVLRFSSSTTQEQAQAQAPSSSSSPNVSTETQVLEPETEEFSRDRLIAQNVPWSCTAEDVRTLFEKHGTVLDVEVIILFFFSFFNLF